MDAGSSIRNARVPARRMHARGSASQILCKDDNNYASLGIAGSAGYMKAAMGAHMYQERWSDDTAKPTPVLRVGNKSASTNGMAFDTLAGTSKMELCARPWISLRSY